MVYFVISQERVCPAQLVGLGEALARVATHLGHGVLYFVVPACQCLTHHPGYCKRHQKFGKTSRVQDLDEAIACCPP